MTPEEKIQLNQELCRDLTLFLSNAYPHVTHLVVQKFGTTLNAWLNAQIPPTPEPPSKPNKWWLGIKKGKK